MKINISKIKNIIAVFAVASTMTLSLSSCEDWLNVKPSNQVAAEEMFSTEEGFKNALTGVYTLMTSSSLYGREMTFATVDYLGAYYAAPTQYSNYLPIYEYKYEENKAKTLVDAIWNNQFNVIANINDLLAFIDANKNVFTSEQVYSVVKGEALALRAYLHFDMLRLFAPYTFNVEGNKDKWLPYVDEFSRNTKESLTNKEFADKVMADINAAIELLKQDPIYNGKTIADTYFTNRNFHLNYYGALALKARAALYFADKTTAQTAAQEVVDAQSNGLFRWITSNEVTYPKDAHRDRTFSTEHIFALNVFKMTDHISGYFDAATTNALVLAKNPFASDAITEYRGNFIKDGCSTKLLQPDKEIGVTLTQKLKRMPMLRISEMHYILAECKNELAYIDNVRFNRGFEEPLESTTNLKTALKNEYDREFIGEGQRFYLYKRLGDKVSSKVRYTLVMPENEINFGGRPRPTK